jgi:hypothetical protein
MNTIRKTIVLKSAVKRGKQQMPDLYQKIKGMFQNIIDSHSHMSI